MRKNHFRTAAAVLTVCLLLTGCDSAESSMAPQPDTPQGQNTSTAEGTVQTADKVLSDSYKAEILDMPGDLYGLYNFTATPDGLCAVGNNETDLYLCTTPADTLDFTIVKPQLPDACASADNTVLSLSPCTSGVIYGLIQLEDHGGLKMPVEYDENFDYDGFYTAYAGSSYLLCTFDKTGALLSETPVEGLGVYEDTYGMISGSAFVPTEDGNIFLVNREGKILRISPDGAVTELAAYETGNGYINFAALICDPNGALLFTIQMHSPADNKDKLFVCEFDPETGTIGEPFYTIDDAANRVHGMPAAGYGDYRFLVAKSDAYYGIKADGSEESLLNWNDSDIEPDMLIPFGEAFLGQEYSNDGTTHLLYLTRREMSEVAETTVLTLGMLWEDSSVTEFVNQYNRSQDAYRIKIVNYANASDSAGTVTNDDPALAQLKLDLVSGNAPDIVIANEHDLFLQLGQRGAFTDLYTFMEHDTEYNRETLVSNVLTAMEDSQGRLFALTPTFSVWSAAVKKKFCDKENWTMADMAALYDNAPDSASQVYEWTTREDMLDRLLRGQDWLVDAEQGKCYFETGAFAQMLEFCNRFTDRVMMPDKETDPEGHQQYYTDAAYRLCQDKELLEFTNTEAQAANYLRYETFGEEYTYVGYPSENGKGGKIAPTLEIAVTSTCADKETAWAFVKQYLTYETENPHFGGMSITEKKFGEDMDESMHMTEWQGDKLVEVPSVTGKLGMEIFPLTQAERDEAERYIRSCDTLYGALNESVMNIIREETDVYFAGDCTAEQAASKIQSRAELMLSEQS